MDTASRVLRAGAPEIVRSMSAGDQHPYAVMLRAGDFAQAVVDQRGVDVIVRVIAPDGTQISEQDSPNGDAGTEPVAFLARSAGTYRLIVQTQPEGGVAPGATYAIRLTSVQTASEHAAALALVRARADTTVTWLAAEALPIRSLTAGSGFADLQPLKRVLRDARIVGLGEATHGSREFFQFKHRMLEFLVREMGFRVFAMEASFSAAENVINPWVLGGAGKPGPVLDSQGFWTWNTEEVRDLIAWMRAYNQSVPAARRVRFFGIDIQVNDEARRTVLAYLRRVAPDRVKEADSLFHVDVDSLGAIRFGPTPDSVQVRLAAKTLTDAATAYLQLSEFLTVNERRFAARTSAAAASKAVRHARVLAEYADAYSKVNAASLRDAYMAGTLKRFLDAEPASTRVVLWAHNGHISHEPMTNSGRPLGSWLKRDYGSAYYAIGFSFGGGAFQARNFDPKAMPKMPLTEFTIPAPDEGSVDWMFGRVAERIGATTVFVNLRRPAASGVGPDWLAEPHQMATIGAMFQDAWGPSMYTEPTVLRDAFDGIVYFRTTTRARPNPTVPNVAGRK